MIVQTPLTALLLSPSVPLWELLPKISTLVLGPETDHLTEDSPIEEIPDSALAQGVSLLEDLASFELLSTSAPLGMASRMSLHHSIICRMLVTAAEAGHLRRLELLYDWIEKPFAIREHLPFWISVEFQRSYVS